MKKILAVLLVLTMVIGLFAGCNNTETPATSAGNDALQRAKSYIHMAYKDSDVKTTINYKVMKAVVIDNVTYPIEWTVEITSGDKEAVKVGTADNVFVTIEVKEAPEEDTEYVLKATIKNDKGESESVSFKHTVPGGMSAAQILDAAYALESGTALDGVYKLTGVVSKIDTPWDDGYGNITVTIVVDGHEDKPMMCYRLKGDGAKDIAVGDTLTVQGNIKNYNGKIEFDQGCELLNRVSGGGTAPTEAPVPTGSEADIVDAAYELEKDTAMSGEATLTGVISKIDTPWSDQYSNITVTIVVAGKTDKPIMCFRMKGDEAPSLAIGDTITVTGKLKNYNGTVEFDSGCKLTARVPGAGGTETPPATEPAATTPAATEPAATTPASTEPAATQPSTGTPSTPAEILNAAYALADGQTLEGSYTLTGVVSKIDTAWSDQYNNITVTIVVDGHADQPMMCYRLKGDGAKDIAVGDTITVQGSFKNYMGTIEFNQGCELKNRVSGGGSNTPAPTEPAATQPSGPKPTTPAEILNAAYALADGQTLEGTYTLTGVVSKIDTAWSDQYNNITVTIVVDGHADQPMMCYRLKGDGAKEIAVGDTITVQGSFKNYMGTIEFNQGCELTNRVSGGGSNTPAPTEPAAPSVDPNTPAATGTVTYDFTSVESGSELTAETAKELFNSCSSNSSALAGITVTKVYQGNGKGGAKENQGGLLKTGSSKADGQIVLTFGTGSKVAKVEILCHDFYKTSEEHPTNSNRVSVNGSDAVLAPYNAEANPETLTFTLDGSSNVVTIDTQARICIYKIIVTFA